ncbi:hypothetical protein [Synoicihabitans lomoniglobus]|uniref:Uncharacterized protein n=1 Tax=Synoicihabitans lomoniglobus TaxID=2909285 RepID=A0AAF0CNF8_9BACT|nr:hypothetical protein [Opitutaceae bacterium LMO-M01]WED65463.1 hypothetical protein PXH66_01195 [Opitutaceae bacterium LMO-M01]
MLKPATKLLVEVGEIIETVGGDELASAAFTATAVLVVTLPALSVARAVSENTPGASGVHEKI